MAVPLTVKIALAVLTVGTILFLIGFSTSYWTDYEFTFKYTNKLRRDYVGFHREHFGLWKRCYYRELSDLDPYVQRRSSSGCYSWFSEEGSYYRSMAGELRATQFFETVALITLVPAVLLLVLGVCVEACRTRRILPILSGVCCLVAGGCAILGAIIYGTWDATADRTAWSFPLAIVGGVCFVISGIVIIVGAVLQK